MSEKIDKRCGTCKWWGIDGFRVMTNPMQARCEYPLPVWVSHFMSRSTQCGERFPMFTCEPDGTDCPCHTPKEAPDAQ